MLLRGELALGLTRGVGDCRGVSVGLGAGVGVGVGLGAGPGVGKRVGDEVGVEVGIGGLGLVVIVRDGCPHAGGPYTLQGLYPLLCASQASTKLTRFSG